ncbi:MAG: alanyl-tRNA editing protein [Candidatus Latescibacteria bacterium]|nr:alanyl-tRNA editing protein [Candidatus Latescibacterota bacterium]NIO28436.1 alanyl-tRNA editing protein [Candidatus Latescibacterota bacterium]NIO55985.1 alanyl-tRNA editing protein [Candidatus Latescibacterota bacterium]NIT01949.1 alanyl-tRNA editing protein [Candidatus Latescibacterota bacterium]
MTDLLYQTDCYLKEFDASVTAGTDAGIVLDRTAFYPGGGGQPADTGVLTVDDGSRYNVTGLKRIEGWLVHLLEGDARPPEGASVHGMIDWNRRYLLMRTHTAMHILCGVIWRDYGAQVTGGNMEPGKGRMDFEFERMQRELVDEIEAKCNAEVKAERPVRISIHSRAEAMKIPDLIRTKINLLPEHIQEVRVVQIVGLDLQADGGTHVANTSEVGPLNILDYKSKGKINKRIVLGLKNLV